MGHVGGVLHTCVCVVTKRELDIGAELRAETEKAYLLFDGKRKVWVPKSQVEDNRDVTFTIPVTRYACAGQGAYLMGQPAIRPGAQQSVVTARAPGVRWVVRNGEKVLQEYWSVKTYVDMYCVGIHGEWRDVPTEVE